MYDAAPELVRRSLFRFRDLRRKDTEYPSQYDSIRYWTMPSEVLEALGISKEELTRAKLSEDTSNTKLNPVVTQSIPDNIRGATLKNPRG